MKILSWNINGLRALHRKGHFDELIAYDADVMCLQETKAEPEQLSEEVRNPDGYVSYFNSSQERKGYSGVAVYTKVKPERVEYGFNHKDADHLDTQGRMLTLWFKDFVLVNCYFPNGGRNQERLPYKLEFYDTFLAYIEKLKKDHKQVIVCGDMNVAHEEIDIASPKENQKNTGFLPEERAWMDEVIAAGWADVFRSVYPDKRDMYTYWDVVTRARDRNVGWRIDYFLVPQSMMTRVDSIKHLTGQHGSDHCPVELVIKS